MNEVIETVNSSVGPVVWLVAGIAFFIVLVLGFALDGLFDMFELGDGILSVTTIGAFGATLGFVGFIMTSSGASDGAALLVGVLSGLVASVAVWGLSKVFENASSSASESMDSLIGREAVVSLRILDDGNPGEVSYLAAGIRQHSAAYSTTSIAAGETVIITALRGESSVNVELASKEPADDESLPEK